MAQVTLSYENEDPTDPAFGDQVTYTVEVPWARISEIINVMDNVAGEDDD